MILKSNKDLSLNVKFSPEEVVFLQLELDELAGKYNQFMSDTNGEGDDSDFPLILTNFANAYIGGILQFINDIEEPECILEVFNAES